MNKFYSAEPLNKYIYFLKRGNICLTRKRTHLQTKHPDRTKNISEKSKFPPIPCVLIMYDRTCFRDENCVWDMMAKSHDKTFSLMHLVLYMYT